MPTFKVTGSDNTISLMNLTFSCNIKPSSNQPTCKYACWKTVHNLATWASRHLNSSVSWLSAVKRVQAKYMEIIRAPQYWSYVQRIQWWLMECQHNGPVIPDSKVPGANMVPTWVLSAPDGPHVGPMNLAIRDVFPCHDIIMGPVAFGTRGINYKKPYLTWSMVTRIHGLLTWKEK